MPTDIARNAAMQPPYDVIVIGAGLGGLSAGLHLQQAGLRVALLERLERAGGLCGTCRHDGREYVIACNDFGLAMPKLLAALGVDVPFRKCRTRITFEGKHYTLPLDWRSAGRLLFRAADLWRYWRYLRQARADGFASRATLGKLVDDAVRDPHCRNLLKLPAYLMGVAPDHFRLDALFDQFEYDYGYWQPMVPVRGPQALADALAEKFREKGDLLLATEYISHADAGPLKRVRTSRGELTGRFLVDASGRDDHYPAEFPRGLPISMYWLAVDRRYAYPDGVHTCLWLPPDLSGWFGALEQGSLPATLGFHVFKSDLSDSDDCYTMNLYFYLPRGVDEPDDAMLKQVQAYLFRSLEIMLPGIGGAIRARHFVSPREFRERHGLSGRVLPVITPVGFAKPANYCAELGIYRAGAANFPPGDHAGAAMLSGRIVAERIVEAARSAHAAFAGYPTGRITMEVTNR
jgi:hypothetical protein